MSLYLKYRPKDFENLMWQSFVKETLKKAIAQNKTVWAYLLCWPRWTGKTTTARLLAKTINCLNPDNWNPCLKCDVCLAFNEERLVDIIEIDAASHTWVDNIRDIIERAQFLPTTTKYKIYIIDEVHMLSKWAFNALLKILEEPPSHVKFILATTETHKVPETIISRCQRYDFKRISNSDILKRLEYISKKENITVDNESYNYIISHSAWGLRNAISLYEQLIIDWNISFENIKTKMWILWELDIDNILNKLLSNDSSVILDIDKIIEDGINFKLFIRDLIFHTKKISLENIKNSKNIIKYIEILDILDDSYSKTKNCLDENTTLIIWILKILSWFKNNTVVENKILKNSTKNTIDDLMVDLEIDKNVPNVSKNDIDDIFWDVSNSNISTDNINDQVNNSNFSNSDFISELKNMWAKWSLTMALRWSTISFSNNILFIKPSTSITRKTVENVDNHALMISVLEKLWFKDFSIKIN